LEHQTSVVLPESAVLYGKVSFLDRTAVSVLTCFPNITTSNRKQSLIFKYDSKNSS